jgi:hypothetical protein
MVVPLTQLLALEALEAAGAEALAPVEAALEAVGLEFLASALMAQPVGPIQVVAAVAAGLLEPLLRVVRAEPVVLMVLAGVVDAPVGVLAQAQLAQSASSGPVRRAPSHRPALPARNPYP